ncbi:uncharacterized protein At3g49055-like [Ziziphus jujuba]|nr:uncharacterized protein At3g49055-like [Ziziphus jujuba]
MGPRASKFDYGRVQQVEDLVRSLEYEKNQIEARVRNLEFVKNQNEERIKSLESAKEKSKKEEEIYGERIKSLESAKEKIEKEAEIYRNRIKSLESAKEKNEKDVEIYRERIKSLESAKEKIEKEAKMYRERFKSLELEVYRERIKNLESVKEKIEKEAEIYKERIKSLEFVKERSEKEEEIYRERIKNLESTKEKCDGFMLKLLESLRLAEERFVRIINNVVDEENFEKCTKESDGLELNGELKAVSEELMAVTKLAEVVELKVNEYKESRKKEKRELENSVVSLTEENRNIDSLLRTALGEMEAVEKSLSRLKGNSEQNRVAILQIAESSGSKVDTSMASAGTKLDGSESEEEVVSLASTVERITKNLNLEISQLRRSLEESRSNTEDLQSLTEKQAQDIAENMLHIRELEDREWVLAKNVEELLMKVKQTEAEVGRWREACELEVEAGKREIEERHKVVAILSQELEKTKTALDISNRKLNEKEELAAAAMAAQSAAEKSLQLADSAAAGLRNRVEELSKQLEEAESRDRNRRKARHIRWPRRARKPSTACMNNRVKTVKRMLSKCKPWRALKPSTATMNNRVKNVRTKKDAVKMQDLLH